MVASLLPFVYKYDLVSPSFAVQKAGRELKQKQRSLNICCCVTVPEEEGGEEKPQGSEDVQRAAAAAGHVLLRPLPEAPRGEGLPLRMHLHGAVLLLLLRDLRVLPRLPLLLLQLGRAPAPEDGPDADGDRLRLFYLPSDDDDSVSVACFL
ncbi:unnamed protein product [Miscanthus lutarioriparius]|uniref:Uncharacterized protein n=1 Tax=Miscanthus lutarioriparius TaxID=422564 RepID=A0A811SI28_9POAL|nr:unnamed protein product [Miscanthus lutarioriparius]